MNNTKSPHLKHAIAQSLYNYIKNNSGKIYFYFAKNIDDESLMPELEIINKSILFNKVSNLDVYMCFKRIDWAEGEVYTEYDANNIYNECYVMTPNFSIYKCLYNANGSLSNEMPTHRTFDPKTYIDGYKWKYLYTLSNKEIHNFLTDEYIPINPEPHLNSIQQQTEYNARRGTVDTIKMLSYGSNYTTARITIKGDGTGAKAAPTIINGQIMAIKIIDAGIGYTEASVVIEGDGVEADAEAHVSPAFGHGSNLLKELNANAVIIISQGLSDNQDNSSIPSSFSYDQIGLISEVKDNSKNVKIALPMIYKVKVNNIDNFTDNEKIYINNNLTCNLVYKEKVNNESFLYINGIKNNYNSNLLLNKDIRSFGNNSSDTILEIISTPLNILNDINILHSEIFTENKEINNKNLDILRLVIKSNT